MKLRQFVLSVISLFILYGLTLGPLCWLHARYPRATEFRQAIDACYGGVLRPVGHDIPIGVSAVRWYTQLWAPDLDVFSLLQSRVASSR